MYRTGVGCVNVLPAYWGGVEGLSMPEAQGSRKRTSHFESRRVTDHHAQAAVVNIPDAVN